MEARCGKTDQEKKMHERKGTTEKEITGMHTLGNSAQTLGHTLKHISSEKRAVYE